MCNLFTVTVHVAIFTIHLDGLRELYRQFLRLPDGAILEVFGDISSGLTDSFTFIFSLNTFSGPVARCKGSNDATTSEF